MKSLVQAPPWRPQDGPQPEVTTWPGGGRPRLRGKTGGQWRYAEVQARHDYADGRTAYQVGLDAEGDTETTCRTGAPTGGRSRA